MSIAGALLPFAMAGPYRANSATTTIPLPIVAIRSSNSISRPNSDRERANLQLGATLLSEDPVFSAFFQDVRALQDEDDDIPPDEKALAEVLRLVPFSRSQLAQRWAAPRVAPDGYGGVRLTWKHNQREVRAVISGIQTTRSSYIYWEDGDEYGTVSNFTPATLYSYLDRLEGEGPFER